MIGGNEGCPALVPIQTIQTQAPIVVDVIEPEDGEPPRKCPGSLQIAPHIGLIEVRRECRRDRSAQPLVEIPKNDSWTAKLTARDNAFIDQFPGLFALFEKPRSKMDVEHVQSRFAESDVGSKATPSFPAPGRDVEILLALYWEPRQQNIAVTAPLVAPVLAKSDMEAEFLRNELRLILFREATLQTDNLLKGNDIRAHFTQHLHDPIGPDATVHSAALVNVIGNDPKNGMWVYRQLVHRITDHPRWYHAQS